MFIDNRVEYFFERIVYFLQQDVENADIIVATVTIRNLKELVNEGIDRFRVIEELDKISSVIANSQRYKTDVEIKLKNASEEIVQRKYSSALLNFYGAKVISDVISHYDNHYDVSDNIKELGELFPENSFQGESIMLRFKDENQYEEHFTL